MRVHNNVATFTKGAAAQWEERLTHIRLVARTPSKAPTVSLSKKLYHHCLALVYF